MTQFAQFTLFILLLVSLCACENLNNTKLSNQPAKADSPPNIVIVITDDQGYGDVGFNGNEVVKTPNIDALAAKSLSLTDYHVSPTCSPTRAAFLTGRFSNRTGVWHTIMGRSMLRENETTIANILKQNGYHTSMFGKWHLGDNFPFRPMDRGFDYAYYHGGGGVGQTPDYWDNSYFDASYFRNGKPEHVDGFVTDVFFNEAIKFVDSVKDSGKPFFTYLATNAPHGPMHAPLRYSEMYSKQGLNLKMSHFYGMITNIDDNLARFRRYLEENKLAENTIFIFTTDNGTVSAPDAFRGNMRGRKGSEYEGGHRVPFYLYWPAGGYTSHQSIDQLTAHVDILPTLLDLAGINQPQNIKMDGVSLRPLIDSAFFEKSMTKPQADLFQNRLLVTDSQRVLDPIKWKQSAVMKNKWRLINGTELYNLVSDPLQAVDIAAKHPETVKEMRAFYDSWWAELKPSFGEPTAIYLGDDNVKRVELNAHDWLGGKGQVPWNQKYIRDGIRQDDGKHDGYWFVNVVNDGEYEIELRRWPSATDAPIRATLPAGEPTPGERVFRAWDGVAFAAVKARLNIAGQEKVVEITEGQKAAFFKVHLPKGKAQLKATFIDAKGIELGAYFVTVNKL